MKLLVTIAAVASIAATGLMAQSSQSGSGAEANSASLAQAGAQSAGGNVTFNNAGTSRSEVAYSGSYKIENNPGLAGIGSITAHSCALSTGVTGSGAGFGLGVSSAYVDPNCELLMQAAALKAVAGDNAAVVHLATGNEAMCLTMRRVGKIGANAICTADEKKAAANAQKQAAAVSTRSAPASSTKLPYRKCELMAGNKVKFQGRSGFNKDQAKLACLQTLGFN